MTDLASEIAALKAQLATITSGSEVSASVSSVWVVYDPSKISVWCSKADCPLLEREITYDVVEEQEDKDGELEAIIKHGLSEEEASDYDSRVMRISSPRVKHHDLGVLASFTSKKKATDFIEEYFRLNRETLSGKGGVELGLSEIKILN